MCSFSSRVEKDGFDEPLIKVGMFAANQTANIRATLEARVRSMEISTRFPPCSPTGPTRSNLAPIISITINRLIKPMYTAIVRTIDYHLPDREVKSRSDRFRFPYYPITITRFQYLFRKFSNFSIHLDCGLQIVE